MHTLSRPEFSVLTVASLLLIAFAHPATAGWVSAYWVTSPDSLLSGQHAAGRVSDLMMVNDRIAVVISALDHIEQHALSGGNVIDAARRTGGVDALRELYTYFDDEWPRQAVYRSMTLVNDGTDGGPAVVRVTGTDSSDPSLGVVTEYSLMPGADHMVISTRIFNGGGTTYGNLELGDAITWAGCRKYAPGYGFSVSGTTSEPWLAATSGMVSYGYMSPDTLSLWGPHGRDWSDVNVRVTALSPGDSATYRRCFIVGEEDIASVATSIHKITAAPVGSLFCSVGDLRDGHSLPAARIDVYDKLDTPYLQMQTDQEGHAFSTLPDQGWQIVASAPGYVSQHAWSEVPLDGSVVCDFSLLPDVADAAIGDTLTVIQRPLLNIPALVMVGDTLTIECESDPVTSGWAVGLLRGEVEIPLQVYTSTYDPSTLWWTITAGVPAVPVYELYDLVVTADGGIEDVSRHAVKVIHEFKDDYYFVHITDTHLPTHLYHYEDGAATDTSEMIDLREVIADIDIINPEFVLVTGDFINEGELEDYLSARYYTRAQRMLAEFTVPVFLTAGNHDVGGWSWSTPPDGTARRDWWRFFGWKRLDDPPSGAPWHTQNYSFDYGPVHFIGLEAYDNYDRWRSEIYGRRSFTSGQMDWLRDDLAGASGSAARVLFYHYDFSYEIDLNSLGVEMALWGHIHSDEGSLSRVPYDLGTNNLSDGERSYRLVRVSNGAVQPSPTLSAGRDGNALNVTFYSRSHGTRHSVTAHINNSLDERFEHAMLRFPWLEESDSIEVSGGTLLQIDDSSPAVTYCVGVDILPMVSQTVTVTITNTVVAQDSVDASKHLWLGQNHPNPFRTGTELQFSLPRSGPVRLVVYDVRGHEVEVLVDRDLQAGRQTARWHGRDTEGRPVSPGVYFARLTLGAEVHVRKIVHTR
jgi:hypothetical protein